MTHEDYQVWKANFGNTCPEPGLVAVEAEPDETLRSDGRDRGRWQDEGRVDGHPQAISLPVGTGLAGGTNGGDDTEVGAPTLRPMLVEPGAVGARDGLLLASLDNDAGDDTGRDAEALNWIRDERDEGRASGAVEGATGSWGDRRALDLAFDQLYG